MKKRNQGLLIPFSGLKDGKHQFEFTIDAEFFEQFEQSLVKDARIEILVDFEKKINLLELDIHFKGEIETVCDRCSDPLELKVDETDYLIVKFGEEESIDEHILFISEGAYELDIRDQIYQLVNLALPAKIEHEKEEDCDQEVIKKLKEYSRAAEKENETEVDPRWDALNKLKNK